MRERFIALRLFIFLPRGRKMSPLNPKLILIGAPAKSLSYREAAAANVRGRWMTRHVPLSA
jgi:hypothetical protein